MTVESETATQQSSKTLFDYLYPASLLAFWLGFLVLVWWYA